MADYESSFLITVYGNEGFYNPGIGEAETYMGLDRGQHPKSPIWPIIDAIKRGKPGITVKQMNAALSANKPVQDEIRRFYKSDFWDTLRLSEVKDQQLANNLFDCSINPCIVSAARVMQLSCNIVKVGSVVSDGVIGSKTIAAINALDPEAIYNTVNQLRRTYYRQRVSLTPSMADWLPIWEKRLIPYKK